MWCISGRSCAYLSAVQASKVTCRIRWLCDLGRGSGGPLGGCWTYTLCVCQAESRAGLCTGGCTLSWSWIVLNNIVIFINTISPAHLLKKVDTETFRIIVFWTTSPSGCGHRSWQSKVNVGGIAVSLPGHERDCGSNLLHFCFGSRPGVSRSVRLSFRSCCTLCHGLCYCWILWIQRQCTAIVAEHAEADAFWCFTHLMSEIRDNFIKHLDDSDCGIGRYYQRSVDFWYCCMQYLAHWEKTYKKTTPSIEGPVNSFHLSLTLVPFMALTHRYANEESDGCPEGEGHAIVV